MKRNFLLISVLTLVVVRLDARTIISQTSVPTQQPNAAQPAGGTGTSTVMTYGPGSAPAYIAANSLSNADVAASINTALSTVASGGTSNAGLVSILNGNTVTAAGVVQSSSSSRLGNLGNQLPVKKTVKKKK